MEGFPNLRCFVEELRRVGELVDVTVPVNPSLELAEIHRRVAAAEGPALLFHHVVGSRFPVATNLFGSKRRVDIAFRHRPEQWIARLVALATQPFPPRLRDVWTCRHAFSWMRLRKVRHPHVSTHQFHDLHELPFLKCWPEDGGDFLTLPLVYTQPLGKTLPPNLGLYRIQRFDARTCGLHMQIQKGGGFHYHLAEQRNEPLPVTIFLGGPPALMLSAILPLPENLSELMLTGILQGGRLDLAPGHNHPHPLISECDFALVGYAPPHVRQKEGPFGDHYGYYSLAHPFPRFHLQAGYHRAHPIFPATIVGKPIQEDFHIGNYLQDMLSPLFPIVMPGVTALWSYGACGFHPLAAATLQQRYDKEALRSAFRILGEGQLSLTKCLFLTDQPVDVKNFKEVLTTILQRWRPEVDLFIFAHLALDTLDYTGPSLNHGSRAVFIGTGPAIRALPEVWKGPLPAGVQRASPYCPGCLVIEGEPVDLASLAAWPLVILVDHVMKTLSSDMAFLWTTFTRFDPASDIRASAASMVHNHIVRSLPILIDARMKPHYPPALAVDPETAATVTRRWLTYFPRGLPMGDSVAAHVY